MKQFKLILICLAVCLLFTSCGKVPEQDNGETVTTSSIENTENNGAVSSGYIPVELNSYDIKTKLTDEEKLELVHGFGEQNPVKAVVYMNGSLSKGDFFTVYADEDPETLKAIQDIAFSGDVTYECLGALEGIGYYGYAYYIQYFMEGGKTYTIFYNMYEENNMIGYDGCWFYPDKPIDTYVFSAVYDAYKRYGEEGKVANAFDLRGEGLLGGPSRIYTPLQTDSAISYTDMTAEEKKEYLESLDTEKIESAFVFMHSEGVYYELTREADGEMLSLVIDYAFKSGEFVPVRETHDGYYYDYYVIFRCADGEEITLYFTSNGYSVRFDGQSFEVCGMLLEFFNDAPTYEAMKYCNQNGKLKQAELISDN